MKDPALDIDTTQILTIREVAEMFQLHPNTIRRLIHRGRIPGAFRIGSGKLGGDWRFNRSMLERWMKESEVKP